MAQEKQEDSSIFSEKEKNHFCPYPLLWLGFAAMGGIGLASFHFFTSSLLFLTSAFFLLVSFWKQLRSPALILSFGFTFALYAHVCLHFFPANHIRTLVPKGGTLWIEGEVLDDPECKINSQGKERWNFKLHIQAIDIGKGWQPAQGLVQTSVAGNIDQDFSYGEKLRAYVNLEEPTPPLNPGEMDYGAYLANHGIDFLASLDPQQIDVLSTTGGSFWNRWAITLKHHMIETLSIKPFWSPAWQGWGKFKLKSWDEVSGLQLAMLLGDDDRVSEDLQAAFRQTGTIHLFAISGQNITALATVLLLILGLTGMISWRWAWLLIPFVVLFCLATGMSASAARACVMAGLTYFGWRLYRPVQPLNILGASVLLLLIWNPRSLFSLSFQFSFLIVYCLLIFTRPVANALYWLVQTDPWIPTRYVHRVRQWMNIIFWPLSAAVAVALVAWISSLPITIGYFSEYSTVAPIANLLINPLADGVVIIGTLSMCLSWVWSGFAMFLNQINWGLIQIIIFLVTFLSQVSESHHFINLSSQIHPKERLLVLSTYAGAPMILESKNKFWFWPVGSSAVWKWHVFPTQRFLGINRLEGIICSQGDRTTLEGVQAMASSIPLKITLESVSLYLKNMPHVEERICSSGDYISLGNDVALRILWPLPDSEESTKKLAGLLETPAGKILWSNRLSEEAAQKVLDAHADLNPHMVISLAGHIPRAWQEHLQPKFFIVSDKRYVPSQITNGKALILQETGTLSIEWKNRQWNLTSFCKGNL